MGFSSTTHRILTQARLGVISGAGPEAGVDLLNKIITTHRQELGANYRTDRDAPYVMLLQIPGMGGPRNPFDLFEEDEEPFKLVWAALTQAIDDMIMCKVDKFCISCNTLHVLQDKVLEYIQDKPIKFVSIIECVTNALVHMANVKKVAIFGSFTTTDLQGNSPYKQLAGTHELVELSEEARNSLQSMIVDVKKLGADNVKSEMVEKLETLITETKADVFVFACTELPLIMHKLKVSTGKTLIDPGLCLCKEILRGAGAQAAETLKPPDKPLQLTSGNTQQMTNGKGCGKGCGKGSGKECVVGQPANALQRYFDLLRGFLSSQIVLTSWLGHGIYRLRRFAEIQAVLPKGQKRRC